MPANQRETTSGEVGGIGAFTRSTIDLFFGPMRGMLEMSHRIMQREAESAPADEEEVRREGADAPVLEEVWGVGPSRAEALRERGISSVADLAEASIEALTALPIVGEEAASKIRASAREQLD